MDPKTLAIKPNLIIAGTVKGGTTSLFSYLSKHPNICSSRIKETCFFLPIRYNRSRANLSEYFDFFSHCDSQKKYIMESTPGYLDGGTKVALEIKDVLKNPKIIFILRNPVDRLISFFFYHKAQMNLPKEMEFEAYVRLCQGMTFEQRKERENDAFWGIDGGRYINYLAEWFQVFGKENIRVIFFDELAVRPDEVMCAMAEWLEIDPEPFIGTNYDIENRTIPYRFGWAHELAIHANKKLEPVLRKVPNFKKMVRFLYYMANSGIDNKPFTSKQKEDVRQLYQEDNKLLASFLKTNGYKNLPDWLIVK